MAGEPHNFVQSLLDQEVRRLVAEAIRTGDVLSASWSAAQILRVYPNCGVRPEEIADQVIMAAAKAGVAIEFGNVRKAS